MKLIALAPSPDFGVAYNVVIHPDFKVAAKEAAHKTAVFGTLVAAGVLVVAAASRPKTTPNE